MDDPCVGCCAPQVVIGTPGTLKRWMTKDRILPPKAIRILVFDEADHMLDQVGAVIERIIEYLISTSLISTRTAV